MSHLGLHIDGPYYENVATVVKWVDGDTVDLVVDLGFHITLNERFRLHKADTPERGEDNYKEATAFSSAFAPPGTKILLRTHKVKKSYDRYIVDVLVPHDNEYVDLGQALVSSGYAVIDPRF